MTIRYLSSTSDKGFIFTPTTDFKVDCYVDADFAGMHGFLQAHILEQDTSCSAPAISFGKANFKQRLCSALAEYVALSSAIRELITIQCILQELVHCLY